VSGGAVIGFELDQECSPRSSVVARFGSVHDQIEIELAERAGVIGEKTIADRRNRAHANIIQGIRVDARSIKGALRAAR